MNLDITSIMEDTRLKCVSIMSETTIGEYLECINSVYRNRGGIENQRDTLKSKSAISIRKRMVSDIAAGCILPPVVIGIKSEDLFNEAIQAIVKADIPASVSTIKEKLADILDKKEDSGLSLIDGMQRTTALIEAIEKDETVKSKKMRLELWLTNKNNSLLYRMLILNSGQIPWDVRRQLEVLFQSITEDIQLEIPELKIFRLDNKRRRSNPGEYQANDLIEMFIAFGSRKEKVDSKEHISQEFTRLDFVDASNKTDLISDFIEVLKIFVRFERIFSQNKQEGENERRQFKDGGALMSSQPMRIGFATACAIYLFGKPGRDLTKEDREIKFSKLKTGFDSILSNLEGMTSEELNEFIDISTLNECLPKTTSRIGEHDRIFFKDAFTEMIKSLEDLPSMAPCWRAY